MSVFARSRRMTDTCTLWSLTSEGEYGAVWASPVTIKCNYREDSEIRRDNQGAQFQPSAVFRFFGNPNIKKGDRIAHGTIMVSEPTSAAETVRLVETKTKLRGSAAYNVYTG